VDGVGWAAHRLPDMTTLGADYYVLSLYKVFGPHIAVLWGRRGSLECLTNQNHFFFDDAALPYPLQPGGVCYELVAGAGGVVAYLAELGAHHGADIGDTRACLERAFAAIAEHEAGLTGRILDFLTAQPGVRIVGDPQAGTTRLPIVSFTVDGVNSSRIPPYLDRLGIGIRWGDFYARRLIDALGIASQDGVVRISLAHYNSATEVERLLEGLATALHSEGS
jgi:selenocysteine lyase/cysteine desulfurase